MTTRHLELTHEAANQPFAVMDTTSDPGRMVLTLNTVGADGNVTSTPISLARRDAQDLAQALDQFSFNFLEDTED